MAPKLDENTDSQTDSPDSYDWYNQSLKNIHGELDTSANNSENGSEKKAEGDASLAQKETNPTNKDSVVDKKEASLYKTDNNSQKKKGRFGSKKGKGFLLGGGVGLVGMFLLFVSMSNQLQLLKLDFSLGFSERIGIQSIRARVLPLSRDARAYRTGDIGESRVSAVGSRIYGNIMNRVEADHGITVERRAVSGRPTSMIVDPDNRNSPLRPTTAESRNFEFGDGSKYKARLAAHFGVPADKITLDIGRNGGLKSTFNLAGTSSAQLTPVMDGIQTVDNEYRNRTNGRMVSAVNTRVFRKFWSAGSMFSPFKRIRTDTAESARNYIDIKRENRAARKAPGKAAQLSSKITSKYRLAREKLQGKVNPGAVGGGLLLTDGLCTLEEIAEVLPAANYAAIVAPSMELALNKRAGASQTRSNQVGYFSDVYGVVDTLTDDSGRSIYEAEAMIASSNAGVGGTPTEPALKQAFSMRGSSIKQLIQQLTDASPGWEAAGGAADTTAGFACSTAGKGFQIGLGIVLIVTGPVGSGFRLAAQVAAGLVIGQILQALAQNYVTDEVNSAALGICGFDEEENMVDAAKFGNCLAHGSRAATNSTYSTKGGVELTEEQELVAIENLRQAEKKENQKKSFFARIFDLKDPQSLAFNSITTFPSDIRKPVLGDIAMGIPSKVVSSVASPLTNKAYANQQFDWGFPLIGVPQELLDRYNDPYENADVVTGILNGPRKEDIKSKAKTCFGVDIKQNTQRLWLAEPVEEVIHGEDGYVDKNCNQYQSDPEWARTMVFVFDDSIVRANDCYDDGEESCKEIGFTTGSTSVSPIGAASLDCSGYTEVNGQGSVLDRKTYSDKIQRQCQELKQKCESGTVQDTEKVICEAFKYDGVLYGNRYSDQWTNGGVSSKYGFNTNVGNFGIQAQAWQNQRVPDGLNPNNLLECSGLTSVALFDAFGLDGSNVGCSGNYTQRNKPSLFRQLEPSEIRPGDFLTLTFSCNSDTSGHVAIAASGVDEAGNIIVYETNSWGKPVRFTEKNLARDFPAGRSRYIGEGLQ